MNASNPNPEPDTLRLQLEAERQALRNLEQTLNREVARSNPRIKYPTQSDWDSDQDMQWRRQKAKCEKLEQRLRRLAKEARSEG
ncbi:MAG: hypothetical protein K0S38_59 [Candidatus Paceibacter sp.]|jgi:hypothetical protein|nr:hypothetical protein [Candidatus Paceibacter sp.]